jgi:hypothetical protein
MELQTKEGKELERLEKLKQETNEEATNRISRELKAETKLKERRDFIMGMFFELTGQIMSEETFQEYNKLFEQAETGYNIKSFIRDKGIEINNKVREQSFEEFKKEQEIYNN